jgi:hypothetical protein
MTTEEYFDWLTIENNYRDPREIGGGRCAYIIPKIFTYAIGTGRIGDMIGVGDCWCYPSYAAARAALDAWDEQGEPEGWIRHPDSGRRVATEPGHLDEDGNVVPVGQLYRRL